MDQATFDNYYKKAREYANTMSSLYTMSYKDNVSFELLGKMIKIRYSLREEEKKYKDVLILSHDNQVFYVTHPVYILRHLKLYAKGRGTFNDEAYHLLSIEQQARLKLVIKFVTDTIEKSIYTNTSQTAQRDPLEMMSYIPCDTENYLWKAGDNYKIMTLLNLVCKYSVFGVINKEISNMTIHNYCIMIINSNALEMRTCHKHLPLWYRKIMERSPPSESTSSLSESSPSSQKPFFVNEIICDLLVASHG